VPDEYFFDILCTILLVYSFNRSWWMTVATSTADHNRVHLLDRY